MELKANLQNGMIVVWNDNDVGVVLGNGIYGIQTWVSLDQLTCDLELNYDSKIVKIYEPKTTDKLYENCDGHAILKNILNPELLEQNCALLWKRAKYKFDSIEIDILENSNFMIFRNDDILMMLRDKYDWFNDVDTDECISDILNNCECVDD